MIGDYIKKIANRKMTGNINLTASMRTNLLSLQQISKLQDRTQLRLSTGLKVNSAIDNPSSYYTAQSLNNRADDLSALLDSMGQGIQTIKAASEGIETAEDLVTQMKAIAEQVNTSGTYVPDKEYFIKEVGENGAVVSTAEELRQAIADNKETICVYGKIDLGDISTTGGLSLQENQKLVGVEYFGNFKDGKGFSSISAHSSKNKTFINITQNNCLVSDLNLNYEDTGNTGGYHILSISGNGITAQIQNLDIIGNLANTTDKGAIAVSNNAICNISKNININLSGNRAHGIFIRNNGTVNIKSKSITNIYTNNTIGMGIKTNNSNLNIAKDSYVNIKALGIAALGIDNVGQIKINIEGKLQIETKNQPGIASYQSTTNNSYIFLASTASIYLENTTGIYNGKSDGTTSNIIEIASGAKLAFEKNGSTKWYEVKENYKDENTSATYHGITADNVETTLNVAQTSSWQTPADIIAEQEKEEADKAEAEKKSYETYQKQFNNALSQYDMLINDSAYKGINLLKEDTLKVNFNEDKSAHLLIQGVDMTSEGIGLLSAVWNTNKDVQTSLEQVLSAQKKLRSAATKLGNCYSIVSERQNFTENLINVLTEGADKLTLADMNEEAANMLVLQTQQQLAINSLSLASQASQKVLRLF